MRKIVRQAEEAVKNNYDLIIIGGGIYGVTLSYIASLKGLKSLLIERDDFGGATSYNSLRILHGGLRYLQKLDLHRFFEAVNERKWFFKNYPGLVESLACLMPLYNRGLHRKSIFRIALYLNDLLSWKRNKGISKKYHLKAGKIISPEEVKRIFPSVDTRNLKGGALWYDGSMPDSQKVLIEILKNSCSMSGTALNYFDVKTLLTDKNNVAGVSAVDRETGIIYEFKSEIVVNTAGPWSREVAGKLHKDFPELFKSSIAWNILFNRKTLSDHAVAITPNKPGAKTYFLRPWKGMLLAGTIHEPWDKVERNPHPKKESINNFINDINGCIPGYNLSEEDILHVFSGLLPAKTNNSAELAVREVILDHSEHNGPKGLYSVSGVKFTTARLVAEKTINKIFPKKLETREEPQNDLPESYSGLYDFDWYFDEDNTNWKPELKKIIDEESVVHLDDLILRRTSIGDNPKRAVEIAPFICSLFNWDNDRRENEIHRVKKYFKNSEVSNKSFNTQKAIFQ